eukprot:4574687-Amphidinium_carterae.1
MHHECDRPPREAGVPNCSFCCCAIVCHCEASTTVPCTGSFDAPSSDSVCRNTMERLAGLLAGTRPLHELSEMSDTLDMLFGTPCAGEGSLHS